MPQESDTVPETTPAEEPTYVISVAAKMVGVAAQTLRYYERQGLVQPQRSQGKIR
ncbi:MAG: MerR family DNA-binding transcriptional regulator, partial [Chloroflexota bacterium]